MGWSSVRFLETGDSYYSALGQEIARAQVSVLFESYIFRMDRVGLEILDSLCKAQDRGVKVFVRLDGIGSAPDLSEIAGFCANRQLELEIFHPLPFAPVGRYHSVGFARRDTFFNRWRLMNRRNHRKLVIIDEKIAFSGGRNVKENQAERYRGDQAWHDLTLRLEGEGVAELVDAFWFRPASRTRFENSLQNYSIRLRKARNDWFARRFHHAEERIWITSPYFAPTPKMLFQLRRAALRGVDIRLVLTRKIDVLVSRLAARGLYRRLLRWGVKIYEFEPRLLHRKQWVFDGISLVGSANFNHRSFVHDLELDVILRDPRWVKESERICLADQAESREVSLADMAKLPWWKRLFSWMAGWFVYWL